MLPQVPPHEFGVPVGVPDGVAVGVPVGVAVGVPDGVAVGVPDGVAVGVAPIVKDKEQAGLGVGEASCAFGILLGTFGATGCCLN